MITSVRATRGMAVAPHSAAAQSAVHVLREGGNALEAMIAAAATAAVAYPHLNALGGDACWLACEPGRRPLAWDASGAVARAAAAQWYAARSLTAVPACGGPAAATVAGTISGWDLAFQTSRQWGGRLPLKRLLADAAYYADHGMAVTRSQSTATTDRRAALEPVPGFAATFLPDGEVPRELAIFRQPRLAETLRRLARGGLSGFYRGRLARGIAHDLAAAGSPLTLDDLAGHRARLVEPLELEHSLARIYGPPPPAQGLEALLMLGLVDVLGVEQSGSASGQFVHLAVEAAKQALAVAESGNEGNDDAARARAMLGSRAVRERAAGINRSAAMEWHGSTLPVEAVWIGVMDDAGRAVSMTQSIHHEFGCGVVLEESGLPWSNRACGLALMGGGRHALRPGGIPPHALCPALARFADGRTMVFGASGGDGQPQTQLAVYTRIASFGLDPQAAINAPRWLLGSTWNHPRETLKMEARFPGGLLMALGTAGHEIEVVDDFDAAMGQAGVVLRHPNGVFEGASDARSDGAAAGF